MYTPKQIAASIIAEIAKFAIINGVKNGLFTGFGFLFIIPFSAFSKAKQIDGIESVARSTYSM